ncbi:MAG: hypothetical protein F4Z05_08165 [Chloroflexi bacterium]|nr:hypothetical protein [Chloroflexota bacterium]
MTSKGGRNCFAIAADLIYTQLMDIQFEIGDPLRPRGHALLYYRVDTEPDHVYGTYIVTLPITADLTKYVPPFLAAHLGSSDSGPLANFAAFAMPPMSELVEGGHDRLVRLANLRNDDLVYGGNMFSYDLARMMESVAGAVQEYADAWNEAANTAGAGAVAAPADDVAIPLAGSADAPAAGTTGDEDTAGLGVNEVLWSFMSEGDRLAEMGRLLGRLRFAQEGNDNTAITDITAEMTALGRHLPDEYSISALVAAASETSAASVQLAQLYLDRCYRLSSGDAEQVRRIEEAIRNLERRG